MLTTNKNKYKCSLCNYDSNKKFNLDRHIRNVHENNNIIITQNVDSDAQNVDSIAQNVDSDEQNKNILRCKCCYKVFVRKYCLDRHSNTCKKIINPLQCELCHVVFSSRSSLAHHRKRCSYTKETTSSVNNLNDDKTNGKTIVNANDSSHVDIKNINNNVNNNVNNNIINILNFPEDGEDFDFIIDKINKSQMKAFITQNKPAIGFNKFANAVWDNPANRCVIKTNANVKYSKVHKGNQEWDLQLDEDVMPLLTHHMTSAALQKVEQFKKDFKVIYDKMTQFREYVDDINTNDESPEYQRAINRLKLMLVNLSRKWQREDNIY